VYFSRDEDIRGTTKNPEVLNCRSLFVQPFSWRAPFKSAHRCTVVHMSRMIKGEFPPRLREACLQSHGFSFFRKRPNDSLSTTVLLVCVWDALVDLNSLFLSSFRRRPSRCIPHRHQTSIRERAFGISSQPWPEKCRVAGSAASLVRRLIVHACDVKSS
jgi:hypothetical protein